MRGRGAPRLRAYTPLPPLQHKRKPHNNNGQKSRMGRQGREKTTPHDRHIRQTSRRIRIRIMV